MSDTLTLETGPVNSLADTLQHFDKEDLLTPRTWTFPVARSALRFIHPDCDFPESAFNGMPPLKPYQLWRNIGSALIREFGKDPVTFDLFDEWSSGRLAGIKTELYKPDEIEEQFSGFDTSDASMRTVEYWAKKGGWNPNTGLLERLENSPVDPSRADELITEVAAASLSPLDFERAVVRLQKITGLGKTALKAALREQQKAARREAGEGPGRVSAADVLIKLGLECELWKSTDPRPELFATVDRGESLEHFRLSSKQFRLYLTHRFFETVHKAPTTDAISQALGVLASEAQEKGKAYEAWLRVARYGEALYLDLADEDGHVVEIAAAGWQLVKRAPVRLIRGGGKPLPIPIKGASIKELLKFINIDPTKTIDLMKIAAWLVAAIRPGFPFPVLLVTGESGAAKTSACNFLKSLIDPSAAQARALPKTEDDLIVTARSNHVIMADNLSGIGADMADAICRLSTGGGNAKRELYTDGEEYIIEAKRPIIINGINIPTDRQDLLSRSLLIELLPISNETRKGETELAAAFEAARPRLLGALLDGVVEAIRGEAAIRFTAKGLPRMADFATFGAASMKAWGWSSDDFLKGYEAASKHIAEDAAKSDQVLIAIEEWLQGEKVRQFEGTPAQLSVLLNLFRQDKRGERGWKRDVHWVDAPNHLSRRIRVRAAGLRAMGVGYEEAGSTAPRLIRLWLGKEPVFAGTPLQPDRERVLKEDAITRNGF
jgi:hypothetical protein